jgi:hypothetical protein
MLNNLPEAPDHVQLNFPGSGFIFLNIAPSFILSGVALGIKNKKQAAYPTYHPRTYNRIHPVSNTCNFLL